MSNIRKTEIMKNDSRATEIMLETERTTAKIDQDERATAIKSENINSVNDWGVDTNIGGYTIHSVIAENTGEATLLLALNQGNSYIIKLYHKNKRPDETLLNIIQQLDSKYVIKCVNYGIYSNRYYEVMPYYQNGDLLRYAPMDSEKLKDLVIPCINEGLNVLHNKNIVHRDIKPSNLFFDEEKNIVVIGDFGISSVLDNDMSVKATSMSRTFGYAAPETANGFISKESDYYSFGITLLHLVTGQDPFFGMTDMEILYQTINKNLEVPKSIDVRLQHLIKGLTLKDRNDRWGYDEILRWLNGEDVDIKESKQRKSEYKPYNFNYNKYYGLEEISMAFAHDWENAKKHLYRGLVDKNIAQYGEEYSVDIAELKGLEDKDLGVFKMIYILNPHAPLCYKGEVYYDLQTLGIKMKEKLPELDEEILQLVTKGCLYDFLIRNEFDDKLCKNIYEITEELKNQNNKFYYALMYFLYPESAFKIEDKEINDINKLVEYLESLSNTEIESIADKLIYNQQFIMWVYSQGYAKQVTEWLNIYEKVEW